MLGARVKGWLRLDETRQGLLYNGPQHRSHARNTASRQPARRGTRRDAAREACPHPHGRIHSSSVHDAPARSVWVLSHAALATLVGNPGWSEPSIWILSTMRTAGTKPETPLKTKPSTKSSWRGHTMLMSKAHSSRVAVPSRAASESAAEAPTAGRNASIGIAPLKWRYGCRREQSRQTDEQIEAQTAGISDEAS